VSEKNRTRLERKYIPLPEAFAVNGTGLPEAVFKLRKRLYIKAKQEPKFRFYALYDRIYRRDVLVAAWDRVAANDGSPGVDGVSDIKTSTQGAEGFVDDLHNTLKAKRYRPQAKRRSQRPYRPPEGVSWYTHLLPAIGFGATMTAMLYCDSMVVKATGKRSAGKLHAAFDEGDQGVTLVPTLPAHTNCPNALYFSY